MSVPGEPDLIRRDDTFEKVQNLRIRKNRNDLAPFAVGESEEPKRVAQ
jgi:hypothetical protein